MTVAIDLSLLPPPQAVEQISFENILLSMVDDLKARAPEYNTISEADPIYKLLQVCAYREVMLRQRENNKTRGLMLAFAAGADLDHIGVTYYNATQRLVLQAAAPEAVPPVAEVLESDADYRRRLLLQPSGESVAGPEQAYVFHALSAHPDIVDASAYSPWPAGVVISVMVRNSLTPSPDVLQAVATKLAAAQTLPTAEAALPAVHDLATQTGYTSGSLRPVADRVIVRPATAIPYAIDADIDIGTSPDNSVVANAIRASLQAYQAVPRALGREVARSAIYAALHLPGVDRVTLNQPAADIEVDILSAAICTQIAVRINGQTLLLD